MSDGILIDLDVEYMAVTRNLVALAAATGRPLGDVIRQNSRLIAVNLATQTQPFGDDRKAKAQGEAAVSRDIRTVYATPQQIFRELRKAKDRDKFTGEKQARAFYSAVNRGDVRKAQDILRKSGIPGSQLPVAPFDGGSAHQRRRNSLGRIGGKHPSMVVTDPKKVERYGKTVARRVGTAKGGWAHVARALGGTRGIPQFATRHKDRVNGTLVDRSTDPDEPYVVMSNTTPWIRQVLNERQQLEALRTQREKMVAHVQKVIDSLAKSGIWFQSAS